MSGEPRRRLAHNCPADRRNKSGRERRAKFPTEASHESPEIGDNVNAISVLVAGGIEGDSANAQPTPSGDSNAIARVLNYRETN